MRTNGRLSCIRLLVPILLFAGVQMFAQAAADSRMPAPGPASHKTTRLHGDVFLISDRTFLMKSIAEIAINQSFKSQAAGTVARPISLHESAEPSCSSNASSVGVAASFCGRIDCAAPPPGCFYQKPPLDQNGCPTGCGTLVCGPIE